MGSAVNSIANQVTNLSDNNFADLAISGLAENGALLKVAGFGQSPTAPQDSAPPQGLQQLQQQQQQYANQFSQNLPQMQNQMNQNLTQSANNTLNAQVKATQSANSARGLGYGGVNQGQQQQERVNSQSNLANAISGSNANLSNAANTLNTQAINTGAGIQQTQQSIQNQIYQQQLAQMQSNNSITGNIASTGLLAGLLLA